MVPSAADDYYIHEGFDNALDLANSLIRRTPGEAFKISLTGQEAAILQFHGKHAAGQDISALSGEQAKPKARPYPKVSLDEKITVCLEEQPVPIFTW